MTTPDPPHRADDDRRMVRVEVEVPASPEQVWEAIATGPGMTAWFVPAEVEGREGGAVVTRHGPFGDSHGVVTAWEPPRRFAYEERAWTDSAGAPPWATEILVEARAGGTCVVRLASGFEHGGEDWAGELEGTDDGWRDGMQHLRIYLTHFAGLPTASVTVFQPTGEPAERAWRRVVDALGLGQLAPGQRRSTGPGAPPLEGIVEEVDLLQVKLRCELPAPGIFDLAVHRWAGRTHVVARGYLYGDAGAAARARTEERWARWLGQLFPAPA